MTKLLHTRSKILFTNPYVVRIEYDSDTSMEAASADYRKLMRRAYKLIHGTWGYCHLEYEEVKIKDEHQHRAPPGPVHFNGMNQAQIVGSLFSPDWAQVIRGYVCFKDEDDALQFRLMLGAKAIRVHMWPESRFFAIHELVEDDCNDVSAINGSP